MVLPLPSEVKSQLDEFQRLLNALGSALEAAAAVVQSPQDLAALTPLQRANILLATARAVHVLHHLHQRSHGRDPMAAASAQQELQRLKQYTAKVQRAEQAEELRNARPTLTLDVAAASRFIDHAIPSLTQEQRQRLRGGEAGDAAGKRRRPPGEEGAGEEGQAGTDSTCNKRGKGAVAVDGNGTAAAASAQQFLESLAGNGP